MKNVLFVFTEVPERTMLFEVELDDVTALEVASFHNNEVNNMEDKILQDKMIDFFYEKESGKLKFTDDSENSPLFNKHFDLVVVCGFLI